MTLPSWTSHVHPWPLHFNDHETTRRSMAHALCLQDWVTLRGAASVAVTQAEDQYLDLANYSAIALWSEVSEFTPGTAIHVESAPTKDEGFFTPGHASMISIKPTSLGVQPIQTAAFDQPMPPLARWVRWRVRHTKPWTITFRIWLAATVLGPR
jgi:hypothetical protein